MRKLPEAEGVMDLLFVHLAEYFREQGYTGLNLGLAPLSGLGENSGARGTEKLAHFFYENFNKFYNFKGLRKYKEKFNPDWEPRYLIYPNIMSLPKVALAIIQANSGSSVWSYFRA
jgi:phosphatidylglycerol lysyltransferase